MLLITNKFIKILLIIGIVLTVIQIKTALCQQATVRLHLRDKANSQPIYGRILFLEAPDTSYIQEVSGFTGWSANRPTWANQYSGEHFWYVESDCEFTIAPGTHNLVTGRGMDYIPVETTLSLSSGETRELTIELERWINMSGRKWYCGDAHMHVSRFDTSQNNDLLLLCEIEEINCSPLVDWAGRKNPLDPPQPFWGGWIWDEVLLSDIARSGDILVFSAQDWSPPGVACTLKIFGHSTPATTQTSEYAKAYVTNNAVAEGGIVTGSLGNIFVEGTILDNVVGSEIFYIEGYGGLNWLYELLNVGCKLSLIAGTDIQAQAYPSHIGGHYPPAGGKRFYVYTEGTFNKFSWIRGIELGNTFVTSGPALFLKVNGVSPGNEVELIQTGTVDVSIELLLSGPLTGDVEIIRNGSAVWTDTLSSPATYYVNNVQLNIPESSWIALRFDSQDRMPGSTNSTAHTSPVYVTVDRRPVFVSSAYTSVLSKIPSDSNIQSSASTLEEKSIAIDWANQAKEILTIRQNQKNGGSINIQPLALARANQTIKLSEQAILDGMVTDDDKPGGPLTVTWSKVDGPGQVIFDDENSKDTRASFTIVGRYKLRMTVSDGALSDSDDVIVNVVLGTGGTTPTKLVLTANPQTITADNNSTSIVTAMVCDSDNNLVDNSTALITFNLSGGIGSLEGTNPVNASGGIATVTYRSGMTKGVVTITATSSGLTQDSKDITLISNNPPVAPTDLTCNGSINPTSITDLTPDFTWTFNDPDTGNTQGAYRILVADSQSELDNNNGNMWDTGKVDASHSGVTYTSAGTGGGQILQPGYTYYWKVMTWDNYFAESPYSPSGTFSIDLNARSFNGTPAVIPGVIEVEDFDIGGEGIAYHDTTTGNQYGEYRTDVDVDINSDQSGGYLVAANPVGEWLEYTVDVVQTGTYTIEMFAGATNLGGTFHIEFDGVDKTGTLQVPDTGIGGSGGCWNSQAISKTGVSLNAGRQIMRLVIDSNHSQWNDYSGCMNYINIASEGPVTPTIMITLPDGGEIWTANTQVSVIWASVGTVGNINIDLSTDGGSNWISLAANSTNDGTETITVPDSQSTTCRIKVADVSGTPSDISNSNFTILPPPQSQITVTLPNGQETWTANTQVSVIWASQGSVGNVDISLSTDGGANWTTLISDTANDGTESTTVPNSPSTTCRIRVADISGSPYDTSNSNFTIEEAPDPESISVNKTTLDFGDVEIGKTGTLDFVITNTGGGTLSGSISTDKKWIEVSPTSFESNSVTISVDVDNSILNQKEGQYTGTISITSNGGNSSVEVTLKATCVLVKPNPYDPSKGKLTFFGDGIVPGKTTIRIYTLGGELIKTLDAGDVERSEILLWRGKNENGEEITNGIYIYIYESPNEKGVGKFTVISK